MPFQSEKQRKLCWTLYNKDKKKGKKPSWDCEEWEEETKKAKQGRLPTYKKKGGASVKKKSRKSSKRKPTKKFSKRKSTKRKLSRKSTRKSSKRKSSKKSRQTPPEWRLYELP
ncbi:MAG: hypothetical protein Edafosvirus3_18 [Edafosvirus sp.]|uniref:Uncharacterized protein n=1 Tax=Edafosvirus sp. TaxID=2487765 RepID=A0A3G4ZSR2_9VIRU|nr:MAG: hypothetical protein Edafosvirus3_18 [Edafosvirus sp.]